MGGGEVNICFHISTKGWTIWCLNRLRLNWNATNIYSNVNQEIISCLPLVMCACLEVQTTYNRELFCEAMMFWNNASVNSTWAQPPPPPSPGYCWAFARLVSPGGGAFANFALPGGRAFANPGAIPEVLTRTRFPSRIWLHRRFYRKKSRLAHLSRTGINWRGL